MAEPKRSEIWMIALESVPEDGDEEKEYDDEGDVRREIRGYRPGLVVSADRLNQAATRLALVVPCTTTDRGFPGHVKVEPPEGGLEDTSFLLCDQVRAVDRTRLNNRIGAVSEKTIQKVEQSLRLFLKL